MPASVQKYSIKKYRANGQTLRMLFLWRGSVYRMVWNEVLIWLIVYYTLNLVYKFALSPEQKKEFELIVTDVETGISFVPLSFVLGFYVQAVVRRYWNMWENLPWPDTLALRISATIQGTTARDRVIRRTAMRRIILAMVLALRKLSRPVMEAYPNLDSLIKRGLLMPDEKRTLESTQSESPPFWMPLLWVAASFEAARKEGRIKDDVALGHLIADLSCFRNACGKTLQVDLIGIPLAYSQVVVIACYTFFIGSMIARQAVESATVAKENYFPFFTILQLVIFIGWLSVAESMIHPFGDDDDDFELNWLIDRHINVTYMMIDVNDNPVPEPREDPMWDVLRQNASSSSQSPPSSPGKSTNNLNNQGPSTVYPSHVNNLQPNTKLNLAAFSNQGNNKLGVGQFYGQQGHLQGQQTRGLVADIYDDWEEDGASLRHSRSSRSRSAGDRNRGKNGPSKADNDALGSLPDFRQ